MKDRLMKVLKQEIEAYKSESYASLLQKTKESEPVSFTNDDFGDSEFFQGEIIFAIDDKKTGDIRIIGEIDDGKKFKVNINVVINRDGKVVFEELY